MTTPLLWEELFSLTAAKQAAFLNEDCRRAPDRSTWLCIRCHQPSKRAHTNPDRLCLVCFEPGREIPTPRKRRARRRRK